MLLLAIGFSTNLMAKITTFFLYRLIIFTLAAMTLDLCEQDHPDRRVFSFDKSMNEPTDEKKK